MRIKIFIFFILFSYSSLFADDKNIIVTDSVIYKGIGLVVLNRYEDAQNYWNGLEEKEYSESEILFYKAITVYSQMDDIKNYEKYKKYFLELVDKCIKSNKENLNKNPIDVKSLYYIGCVMCFMGLFYAENDDWAKAANYGLSGISYLKKCISVNSEYKEPILFINIFEYYKRKLTSYVGFIPYLKDNREGAINQIRSAMDIGINRFFGRNQLVWILLDYGSYEEAIKVSLEGLKMFPQSRFYLWGTAEAYIRNGDFNSAIRYLKLIRSSLKNNNLQNEYVYLKCLFKLAECNEKINNLTEIERIYKEILSLKFNDSEKGKNIIDYVRGKIVKK